MVQVNDRKTYLSATSIGLLTAAAVVTSLRGLPLLAKEEMTMFAYLVFTVVFYLIPASLVSAELGGAFADKKGGIYAWVGEAFGIRWGFLAIWLQWIQNVVWYPVALTFGAAALAYTIGLPELAKNGIYVGSSVSSCIGWRLSSSFKAWRCSPKIANWTFILGTILPGVVLVLLLWLLGFFGAPDCVATSDRSRVSRTGQARYWPSIHGLGTVAFLAGIVLLFAGVEVQAVHVTEMKSPAANIRSRSDWVRSSPCHLRTGRNPVAAILPYEKISLQSAVFDTFSAVIADVWHIGWLNRCCHCSGRDRCDQRRVRLAWQPMSGFARHRRDGEFPTVLHAYQQPRHANTHTSGARRRGNGDVLPIFVIADVSVVFFLISAMTIALYLIAYMFMYAAAIKLRYSRPTLARPFSVPGGLLRHVADRGCRASSAWFSAFWWRSSRPISCRWDRPGCMSTLVIIGTVVFCGIPLVLHATRRPNWASGGLQPAE